MIDPWLEKPSTRSTKGSLGQPNPCSKEITPSLSYVISKYTGNTNSDVQTKTEMKN